MSVTIYVRVTDDAGKQRYLKPVKTGNGKLKAGCAWIDGQTQTFSNATFALRYRENGKRKWEQVGSDPAQALIAKLRREHILKGRELGQPVASDLARQQEAAIEKRPIGTAVETYLTRLARRSKERSVDAYTNALRFFATSIEVDDLNALAKDEEQIQIYLDKLLATGVENRTAANRLGYVQSFLIANGINSLIKDEHWPKYTKREPNAYTRTFLQKLFAACNDEERMQYKFFLYSGCREQEVMYMTWPEINFERGTCQVREQKQYGWCPKDYEERSIPLRPAFVAELVERRRQRPDDELVFATKKRKPNGHFLRKLKKICLKASLNCGHCINKKGLSCKNKPVCDEIELHRFRRTFATIAHHGGQSVKTIQRWLGHADIETTMRYLASADDDAQQVRECLDQAFAFVA